MASISDLLSHSWQNFTYNLFFFFFRNAGSWQWLYFGLMVNLVTFHLIVTSLPTPPPSPPPMSASLKQTVYVSEYVRNGPFTTLPQLMWFIGRGLSFCCARVLWRLLFVDFCGGTRKTLRPTHPRARARGLAECHHVWCVETVAPWPGTLPGPAESAARFGAIFGNSFVFRSD